MSNRYVEEHKGELVSLQCWRRYCEERALAVMNGKLHLGDATDTEAQKKKDYFLYKYYEFQFDKTNDLIDKLCHIGIQ